MGFLFLLPLGVSAFCFSAAASWLCAFFAIIGNGLFALWLGISLHLPVKALIPDLIYFTVIVVGFAWVVAPPAGRVSAFFRPRTVYRVVAASALGALALAFPLYISGTETGFLTMLRTQAELFVSLYNTSTGADVVERSLSEQYVTVDYVIAVIKTVSLRGGALFSCMLLFVVSRQFSALIARFARRRYPNGNLVGFHTSSRQIWVLSFSLAAILAGLLLQTLPSAPAAVQIVEIAAWNVLVICVMLYLVQGGGVLMYWYTRFLMPPLLRLLLNLALIIVIFSPGINAVFLAGLVLLGIAENWVPFRVPKTNGSSSTPGSGE
jgi:hypothetical protein